MDSRYSIKRHLIRMMNMFGAVWPLYMYSLEYDEINEILPKLYGHDRLCFRDTGYANMVYGNVVRKIFMAVIIQMIKQQIIHIDISDILDMELERMDNLRYLTGGEKAGEVMGHMFHKLLCEYGYVHESSSYKSKDFTDEICETVFSSDRGGLKETDKRIKDTFKSIVSQKDFIMVEENIVNIQEDVMNMACDDVFPETLEINTVYNRNLTKVMKKKPECMSECERRISEVAKWMNDIIIGDRLSSCNALQYDGEYVFSYCNWLHPCYNCEGLLYFSVKKDYRDLNLALFFAIPLIDLMLDKCDI